MKIETKYNIGDDVYFIDGKKLKQHKIFKINAVAVSDSLVIKYGFRGGYNFGQVTWKEESQVYKTPDEFIKDCEDEK